MSTAQARTVCLLLLLALHTVRADYYSAVTSLKNLLKVEMNLASIFDDYMKAEQHKYAHLKELLKQIEVEQTKIRSNHNNHYLNPLNVFKSMKRFARDWKSIYAYNMKMSSEAAHTEAMKFSSEPNYKQPVMDDLMGAARGVARLQEMYKLDTTQLANGTIMDQKIGLEMLASDCYELGSSLVREKNFKRAVSWLLEARVKLAKEAALDYRGVANRFPIIIDRQILEQLVPATNQSGNMQLTQRLAREQLVRNANNSKALEILLNATRTLMEQRLVMPNWLTGVQGSATRRTRRSARRSAKESGIQKNARESSKGSLKESSKKNVMESIKESAKKSVKENVTKSVKKSGAESAKKSAEKCIDKSLKTVNEESVESIVNEIAHLKRYDKNDTVLQPDIDGQVKSQSAAKIFKIKKEGNKMKFPSEKELYEKTCRGELIQTPREQRKLRCKNTNNQVPFYLLAPFKVEELSLDPYVAIYYNVIYESEMAYIVNISDKSLKRSQVGIEVNTSYVSEIRTSKNTWLRFRKHRFLKPLSRRLPHITGLSIKSAEWLQVANYGIGGHYGMHFDFAQDEKINFDGNGNRILTALFYISQPKMGGATAFPFLRLAVPPVKGSMLMWYNLHESLELDYRTKHAACPVIVGSKWICTEWFHVKGQEFLRPCSLTQEGHKSNRPPFRSVRKDANSS